MTALQLPIEKASPSRELTADLPIGVGDAVDLVEELAGLWGGELERSGSGGRLALPVSAGVRHGLLRADVSVRRLGGDGSRVDLHVRDETYRLHVSAVAVLLIGAAGGLFLILGPLVAGRRSIELLPPAFIVMLAAWFLVASRMRHRNASDFLESLRALARRDRDPTP
ncbi:MAG TPA: hypothetical protein VMT85_09135 [Thermoanaerobaculia bacterium]|nr:hypothetical protein [Thermoanaerobaculia bacterium]